MIKAVDPWFGEIDLVIDYRKPLTIKQQNEVATKVKQFFFDFAESGCPGLYLENLNFVGDIEICGPHGKFKVVHDVPMPIMYFEMRTISFKKDNLLNVEFYVEYYLFNNHPIVMCQNFGFGLNVVGKTLTAVVSKTVASWISNGVYSIGETNPYYTSQRIDVNSWGETEGRDMKYKKGIHDQQIALMLAKRSYRVFPPLINPFELDLKTEVKSNSKIVVHKIDQTTTPEENEEKYLENLPFDIKGIAESEIDDVQKALDSLEMPLLQLVAKEIGIKISKSKIILTEDILDQLVRLGGQRTTGP